MDLRSYRRSLPVEHTNQIGSARGDAFGNFLAPVVRPLLGVGRADGTSLPHQRATLGRRSPVDRLAGATTTRHAARIADAPRRVIAANA